MMKRNLIFGLLLSSLSFSNVVAQIQAFSIDASHSKVGFTVSLGGLVNVEGTFPDFKGTILYNEQDMSTFSVSAMITVATIHTGEEHRDQHLQQADFFDAERFPNIVFRSTGIKKSGKNWLLSGLINMKGIEKKIEFPLQKIHGLKLDPWENPRITFTGALALKRSDFGIGAKDFWGNSISDEIRIQLTISGRIFNTDMVSVFENGAPGKLLYDLTLEKGPEAALEKIEEMKKTGAEFLKKSSNLDWLGRRLIQYKMPEKALKILAVNAQLFPKEARVHSYLAYAYFLVKNNAQMNTAVQAALQLDKSDTLALELQRLADKL
jgi:polyisoprenoid-binding protein YceI